MRLCMEREILTKEKILYDFKAHFVSTLKFCAVALLFCGFLSALTLIIFTFFKSTIQTIIIRLLLISPYLFICYITISIGIEAVREYRLIIKGEFEIVTDTVIDTIKKKRYHGYKAASSKANTIFFSSYGSYVITDERNYTWSRRLTMNDDDLLSFTCVGDEFYLVVDKNKKILLVYNLNMFKMQQ